MQLVPPVDARARRNPLRFWIPLIVLTVALASTSSAFIRRPEFQVFQDALGRFDHPVVLWIGAGAFLLANLASSRWKWCDRGWRVFGGVRGGLVALIGSLVAATVGYLAGRAMGPAGLPGGSAGDRIDRPATRGARYGRRDGPAARISRECGIGSSVVRRGARAIRHLHARHIHRLDAGRSPHSAVSADFFATAACIRRS